MASYNDRPLSNVQHRVLITVPPPFLSWKWPFQFISSPFLSYPPWSISPVAVLFPLTDDFWCDKKCRKLQKGAKCSLKFALNSLMDIHSLKQSMIRDMYSTFQSQDKKRNDLKTTIFCAKPNHAITGNMLRFFSYSTLLNWRHVVLADTSYLFWKSRLP